MSPLVLQYLLLALQALPGIIAAGGQLEAEVAALIAQLNVFQAQDRDPTAAEWASQNGAMAAALALLAGQNASLKAG